MTSFDLLISDSLSFFLSFCPKPSFSPISISLSVSLLVSLSPLFSSPFQFFYLLLYDIFRPPYLWLSFFFLIFLLFYSFFFISLGPNSFSLLFPFCPLIFSLFSSLYSLPSFSSLVYLFLILFPSLFLFFPVCQYTTRALSNGCHRWK